MERRTGGKAPQTGRDARLKAALKANLRRRKAQARARDADAGADDAADAPPGRDTPREQGGKE